MHGGALSPNGQGLRLVSLEFQLRLSLGLKNQAHGRQ